MREYLDSEILIAVEVLTMGDFVFQRECLGKMEDVAGALYYSSVTTSQP